MQQTAKRKSAWRVAAILLVAWLAFGGILWLSRTVSNPFPSDKTLDISFQEVSAQLIGDSWEAHSSGNIYHQSLLTQQWTSTNRKLYFEITIDKGKTNVRENDLGTLLTRHNNLIGAPGYNATITRATLNNYPAIRIEDPGANLPDGTHNVEYIIVAHGRAYYIGAWALNDDWSNGGSTAVQKMFDSVRIR